MRKLTLLAGSIMLFAVAAAAQGVTLPRESQRQEIAQTVGDTKISIIYHRPNVRARSIWGGLVPYDEVWRAGANEATLFEFSRDVTINGNQLKAGKYSFHVIPTAKDWTLIFNNDEGQWGSFSYDAKQDAVRATVQPKKVDFTEALTYSFDDPKADVVTITLRWENLAVPFTVGIGDLHGRMLTQIRNELASKTGAERIPLQNQFTSYVVLNKLNTHHAEAMTNVDAALAARENFGSMYWKARLLKEQGKTAEAIALGEKAVAFGRSSTPPTNPNFVDMVEGMVKEWKAGPK